MHARVWLVVSVAGAVAVVLGTSPELPASRAVAAVDAAALTGIVSSAEEGAMEGVLVSAKRTGSTHDHDGRHRQGRRYRFPRTRLEAGSYALGIRAVGYDLAGEPSLSVAATVRRLPISS